MHDPTLRHDLAAHAAAHPGAGYPPHLRDRAVRSVLALRAAGATWLRVSAEVGLSTTTLRQWSARPNANASFLPVVVSPEGQGDASETSLAVSATRANPAPQTFSLWSPRGFRVDGLELAHLTQLLGQLG